MVELRRASSGEARSALLRVRTPPPSGASGLGMFRSEGRGSLRGHVLALNDRPFFGRGVRGRRGRAGVGRLAPFKSRPAHEVQVPAVWVATSADMGCACR